MTFSLSPETKEILAKRLKSLLWRAGAMLAIIGINFTAQNLGLFDLPDSVNVAIGLLLAEFSKFLNSNLKKLRSPGGEQ